MISALKYLKQLEKVIIIYFYENKHCFFVPRNLGIYIISDLCSQFFDLPLRELDCEELMRIAEAISKIIKKKVYIFKTYF